VNSGKSTLAPAAERGQDGAMLASADLLTHPL
jgi:hypothetical protein